MFKSRIEARVHALRELAGNDDELPTLLRGLSEEHPRAFAWLMRRLDERAEAIREERLAAVPPELSTLPEGKLEEANDEAETVEA